MSRSSTGEDGDERTEHQKEQARWRWWLMDIACTRAMQRMMSEQALRRVLENRREPGVR